MIMLWFPFLVVKFSVTYVFPLCYQPWYRSILLLLVFFCLTNLFLFQLLPPSMAASSEIEASCTTCVLCGFSYPDDNVGFAHYNFCHVTDFVHHLRERRLHDLFPRADPVFFEILYSGDDSWYPPCEGDHDSDLLTAENETVRQANHDERANEEEDNIRSETSTPCTSEIPVSKPTKAKPKSSTTKQTLSKSRQEPNDDIFQNQRRRNTHAEARYEGDDHKQEEMEISFGTIDCCQGNDHEDQEVLEDGERPTTGTGSSWGASARSRSESHASLKSRSRSRSRSPRNRSRSPPQSARRPSYRNVFAKRDRGPLTPYIYRDIDLVPPRNEYDKIPVYCVVCRKPFENYLAATAHDLQTHGEIRRLRCGFAQCKFAAPTKALLAKHVEKSHKAPHLRFRCRFCHLKLDDAMTYVDHAWDEYSKLRRIHYEQIALQSLTSECRKCKETMVIRDWFLHRRRWCRTEDQTEEARSWIEEYAKFCCHQRTPCKFFPICDPQTCSFSHPICAHFPNCYNYKNGKCPLEHAIQDRSRSCDVCQRSGRFGSKSELRRKESE